MPYRVSAPCPIPLCFQEPANLEIARHIESGVIVPCDEPTDWCSPAFFVPKGDGKQVRLVTDYTKLIKYVVQPVHPFLSVADIVRINSCLVDVLCKVGRHSWLLRAAPRR